MQKMRYVPQWGLFVTRVGLAGVLIWFGSQQFLHTDYWIGYVPNYATSLTSLAPEMIVFVNGGAEIVFGILLLIGLFTRFSALVMGTHLALIALSLGFNEIGVRDWGLAAAFFGIALSGPGSWSLD